MPNNVIPSQTNTIMDSIYLPGRVLNVAAESLDTQISEKEVNAPLDTDHFDVDAAMDSVIALESLRQELIARRRLHQTPSAHGINAITIAIESISDTVLNKAFAPKLLSQHAALYERHSTIGYAIESITENIKRIVGKIIAWIRTATRKVSAYLTEVFKGAEAQARKAAAINAAAVKAKARLGSGKAAEGFDDTHSFAVVLGEVSSSELVKNYQEQMKEFTTLFDGRGLISSVGTIRRLVQEMDKADTKDVTNEDVAKVVNDCIEFLEKNAFRAFHGDDDNRAYALKVGGASLKLAIAKSGAYKTSVSVTLEKPENTTIKLNALSIDEIVELTNAVTANCKKGVFPDYSKVGENLSTLADDIERLCGRIVQRHSVKGGEIGSLHMLKQITHCLMDLARLIYSYNIRVTAAVNTYCADSLKALEKEHGGQA